MAKDERSKLLDAINSAKEELSRDNGDSKEEREFQAILRRALREGRIPIECIEEIEVSDDIYMKTIVMKEC